MKNKTKKEVCFALTAEPVEDMVENVKLDILDFKKEIKNGKIWQLGVKNPRNKR